MSNKPLLIVASSGRMLATSARKAGFIPLVIDLYADSDTQQVAESCHQVSSFNASEIFPVIELLSKHYAVNDVVYGSGLEVFPDTVEVLQNRLNILGNSSGTFNNVVNKQHFFSVLDKLNITYPEVIFNPSLSKKKGLIKPFFSEGGQGITTHSGGAIKLKTAHYWQQFISGVPMSVLFLADAVKGQLIGFNLQWTLNGHFLFSGVLNAAPLPEQAIQKVFNWVEKIIPAFALKGLNCLDFIWDGVDCWVLEVNPRPSASMILYDANYPHGLLHEHIKVCHESLQPLPTSSHAVTAYQVLYAQQGLHIPSAIEWPEWTLDRPKSGSLIAPRRPVCSILASAENTQKVLLKLRHYEQILLDKLEGKLLCNTQPVLIN